MLNEAAAAASSCRRQQVLGGAASPLQGCLSVLGWDEVSIGGQASLHPLLASSQGLASLLPPHPRDSGLSSGEGHKLPWGGGAKF